MAAIHLAATWQSAHSLATAAVGTVGHQLLSGLVALNPPLGLQFSKSLILLTNFSFEHKAGRVIVGSEGLPHGLNLLRFGTRGRWYKSVEVPV